VVGNWGPEAATTGHPRPRGPPPPLAAAPPLPLPPLLRAPLDLRRRSSREEEEAQADVRLPPLPRPATRRIRWSRVQEAAAGRRSRPRLQEAATGRRSRPRLEGQRAAAPLSPSAAQMEALDGDLDDNGEGTVDGAGGRRTLQSTANAPRRGAGLQAEAEAETMWDPQRLGRGTCQISRECGSVGRSPQNAAGVAPTAGGATVRPPSAFCTCEAGSGSRWRQSYASILFIRDIMHQVRTGSITSIDVRIYSVVYRSTEFGFQNHSTVRPNPTSRGQIRWAENSSLCVWPFSGWRGSASCSSQIWAERTQICLSCW
jgi:hypothetical protein